MADAYFNNASGTDINEPNNWWTDDSFTTPYGSVPDFVNAALVLQIGDNSNGVSCDISGSTVSMDCSLVIGSNSILYINNTFDLGSSASLTINSNATVYVNFSNPGTLGGTVINNGTFNVGSGTPGHLYISGTFTNYGTIEIFSSTTVEVNGGTFTLGSGCANNGAITSTSGGTIIANSGLNGAGSVTTAAGASLAISGGTFGNYLTNNGTATISSGATFSPPGQTANNGSLTNNGTITQATETFLNAGLLTLNTGSINTFSNTLQTNGSINILAGVIIGTLYTTGGTVAVNHSSSGVSVGRLNMQSGSTLNVTSGSLTLIDNALQHNIAGSVTIGSSGSLSISSGTAICTGTIVNNGTFNVIDTLIITNSVENNSAMTVSGSGVLGICSNAATAFTNNGTFVFGSYVTRFKGKILPQVPSSASWGNALL